MNESKIDLKKGLIFFGRKKIVKKKLGGSVGCQFFCTSFFCGNQHLTDRRKVDANKE
jgi:hypothetical protein